MNNNYDDDNNNNINIYYYYYNGIEYIDDNNTIYADVSADCFSIPRHL